MTDRNRDLTSDDGDEMIRDGDVIIEERMNRRDGLVEYEGTVGAGESPAGSGTDDTGGGTLIDPTTARTDIQSQDPDQTMVGDGRLVVEERMGRRDGLVDHEGTVGNAGAGTDETTNDTGGLLGGTAMQAGATILGGTGSTAMVDDAATMAGGLGDDAGVQVGTSSGSGIDMSTDNSATGRIATDTAASGPIAMVQDHMKVVDANGEDLGKVEYIKLGDPQTATTSGQEMGVGGAVDALGDVGDVLLGEDTEPDVEEPLRSQLLRTGFVKIDGKGWFGTDRYVPADQIASVTDDTVRLSVTKDQMVEAS